MFNATTYNPAYQTRNSIVPAVRWLDGEWRGKDDFYKCGMRQEFVERELHPVYFYHFILRLNFSYVRSMEANWRFEAGQADLRAYDGPCPG